MSTFLLFLSLTLSLLNHATPSNVQSNRIASHLARIQTLHKRAAALSSATTTTTTTKRSSNIKSSSTSPPPPSSTQSAVTTKPPVLAHPPKVKGTPTAPPPPLPSKKTAMRFAAAKDQNKESLPFLHPWEPRKGNPFGGGGMKYQPSMYKHPPAPPAPPPPPPPPPPPASLFQHPYHSFTPPVPAQPAGFKETSASINGFQGLSPESKLGHLGASLGNQAFHTVASQQQQQAVAAGTQQDLSKVAAAGTQRFQSSFQSTWKKINEQRMAAMKKKKKKNEKKLHFGGGGGGGAAASGSSNNSSSEANNSRGDGDAGGAETTEKRTTTSTNRALARTSTVPSMEDMMKEESTKNMNHNLKVTAEQGGLVKLTNEQRAYFELHPDLLQQFQQQQIDLIQSKKDEDAVKKALFGNIGEAPPPSDAHYFFL